MMKKNSRLKGILLGAFFTMLVVGLTVPILAAANSRTVSVTNDDIKLIVNGQTITTTDNTGKGLKPVYIDGVAYIPAQAVSNAFNMNIILDKVANTITLHSKALTNTPNETGYIGLEKAKKIALEHAGISASKAFFYKAEIDFDDGRVAYEIEFYSGNVEYDYNIDPTSGKILSWDHEVEGYTVPVQNNSSATQTIISLEKAKSLAKAKAPSATLLSCKLDYDDGKQVYEGELRDGKTEYDFEIDAVTGSFLKWETDYDD